MQSCWSSNLHLICVSVHLGANHVSFPNSWLRIFIKIRNSIFVSCHNKRPILPLHYPEQKTKCRPKGYLVIKNLFNQSRLFKKTLETKCFETYKSKRMSMQPNRLSTTLIQAQAQAVCLADSLGMPADEAWRPRMVIVIAYTSCQKKEKSVIDR